MGFMTILHGDDRFYNNIFVQKWRYQAFHHSQRQLRGNRRGEPEVGTHVMDEYPTYDEWIKMFDMDTDTPDMIKLEPGPWRKASCMGKRQCLL